MTQIPEWPGGQLAADAHFYFICLWIQPFDPSGPAHDILAGTQLVNNRGFGGQLGIQNGEDSRFFYSQVRDWFQRWLNEPSPTGTTGD
ncbi:MAG: hypothetical protein ACREMS_00995 [Gemmatimonadaceae bacterium]